MLRHDEKVFTTWTDAICINQLDIPERNAQVGQMGRIYSSASHTVIFLDFSSADLELLLQGMRLLNGSGGDARRDQFEVVYASFERIMSRPWFHRVWILQELVLSRDPFVQCGMVRVRWIEFCNFETVLGSLEKEFIQVESKAGTWKESEGGKDITLSGTSNIDHQQHIKPKSQDKISIGFPVLREMFEVHNKHQFGLLERQLEDGNSLSSLVVSRRGHGATDPRDIIYAQFGVASDTKTSHSTVPAIDYGKSVIDLFAEMTFHMFLQNMNVFGLLERKNTMQSHIGLPSWVPDWTKPWNPISKIGPYSRKRGRYEPAPFFALTSSFENNRNKRVLAVKLLKAAEIVQMGNTVGIVTDLPEAGKMTTEYFQQDLKPHEINELFSQSKADELRKRSILKRYVANFSISENEKLNPVYHCFGRILQAWASAIGLPSAPLLPIDVIDEVAQYYTEMRDLPGCASPIWHEKGFDHRPFLLMAVHNGFTTRPDYDPLSTKADAHDPLYPTEKFCTIRRTYYPDDDKVRDEFQIIAVPEISRVGDIIAYIREADPQNLVVLRPVEALPGEGRVTEPMFEVVGSCRSNVGMGGIEYVGRPRLSDKMLLV